MTTDELMLGENEGSNAVCALLSEAPSEGLECDIIVTFTTEDGDKAGMHP